MHAPDLQSALSDSVPLLASAKHGFALETPATTGEQLGAYATPWGEKVTAVAQQDLDIMVWKGTTLTPTLHLNTLKYGMLAGTKVGTLTFSSGTNKASTPIILKQTYSLPSFW